MSEYNKIPGHIVPVPGGGRAFVPNPLPPDLDWSPQLAAVLSEADRALGRLAGEGREMPNPHLLIRPFIRREAVLSSRIEGTQTTLAELLAAEVTTRRLSADTYEVANYVIALEYGMRRLRDVPLSLELLRELHAKLMKGVRGEYATPGEFRSVQNWIGPAGCGIRDAVYVPPPPAEMHAALAEWERFLRTTDLPPLVHIGLAHWQFEAIHPFVDGNGRIGRLLITLFLVERKVLSTPLLYLSAFFEATRPEYYRLLNAVSDRGAWTEWLLYFLRGVARQSEDAVGRLQQIKALLDEWGALVSGESSKTPAEVVKLLAENPFWTITRLAKRLDVAYTTAQRAVEKLVSLSMLTEVSGARRDRVFCARRLLDILEAPARLTP